ncbi:Atp-Binding Cassette Sub-Family D Member 3 [Manis pentadactyla]|nr:Atp-Binding Cassette Sub-Family D Member 3 [Manis pentadactyla]
MESQFISTVKVNYLFQGRVYERTSLGLQEGSSSDVKCQNLVPGLGLGISCECAIQFQDYSEARVISMMTVEFQATVLR